MDQKRVVWVAEVVDRATLVRLIRAALLHEVASVKLARTPVEKGTHTLQLRLNGEPLVVLAAESKGRHTKAGFALQLAPLDPSHVPELQAIVNAGDEPGPPSTGPMSTSASAIFDSEPPLPVGMRGHAKTVPDPEPYDDSEDETDPFNEERLGKSTLFDPDAAVVGRSPRRANTDDTLTIPARSSMMPPQTPAARTPRNDVDADALSTARSAASPLVAGMSEARISPRQAASSSYSSAATATPEPVEGTLIMVEHADPVTSQSSVHTLRTKDDEITDWDTDGPDAPDPSLSESVVFDPDILAREVHHSGPDVPPTVYDPPAGADGESISVIFGNEETLQGAGAGAAAPSKPVGVVLKRHVDDELSLTPTAPIDVPAKKPSSKRKDPSQRVTEESDTFPSASTTDPDASSPPRKSQETEPPGPERIPSHMPKPGQSSARMKAAPPASSKRQPPATVGAVSMPRTQKRNTAQMITGGRIIANRYRIETLVGAGAVGAVFKAAHVDLPRTFAIKLLHPHYRADPHLMASFRAEARAASLLDHPNVTVVHDFGEEPDGLVYIVMEYLQGINLQALLDEERRLSPRRAIEIMLQVCGALAAAHERGIVHRDVKPDNIMLVPTRNDEGEMYDLVKVCDFGIAALETAPGAEGGEITAGTPEYMAPEQAAGRADARTDVYACGIVLYEMLVGKPPFVGDTPIGTLAKHAKERAKRPSEILVDFPPALEAIIMCAIEKQPERRFQKMRELRAELKRLLG